MDDETNPEAEAPEVEAVATEDAPLDVDLDDEGNPVEPEPELETIEIERGGKKFQIPKELESELLMQSDYTKKTQSLAEERRQLEQVMQLHGQASQAERDAQARVSVIREAVADFETIDWDTWTRTDPSAAQTAFMQYQLLQKDGSAAVTELLTAQHQRQAIEQQQAAQKLAEASNVLTRLIPDWHDKAEAVMDFGMKTYGYSKADLDAIDDPRHVKVLHDAYVARTGTKPKPTANATGTTPVFQPAKKVAGGATPARTMDDRTDVKSWMKAREAAVRKQA
mgnify:CR=1 FL=1